MPPVVSSFVHRLGAAHAAGRRDALRIALVASLHMASLAIMAFTEADFVAKLAFLLAWGILNFFWLGITRRPAVSAALSLLMIVILVLLSRLKFDIIWMTANFLDVMIIDKDTISFLLSIMPGLTRNVVVGVVVVVPLLVLLWRIDTSRMRMRTSLVGFGACLAGITAVSLAQPQEDWETFLGGGYVSKFARSGVTALSELMLHGYMESDAVVTDRLKLLPDATCVPAQKPPHIIMVHDESSFDIRVAPGVKVPAGYGSHFLSLDGKARHFVVEGAGGPSWYTEYNVLAGLSARSFGKFAYYVTRIAAGRVERGLPTALRRCGYHTFSIYAALGACGGFLGGWLADRWGGRRVVMLSFLFAAPLYFGFLVVPGPPGLALLVLGSFVLQTSLPVNVVMGQELSPRHSSTISSLLMGAAWGLGALILGPVGALSDRYGLTVGLAVLASTTMIGFGCAFALPRVSAPLASSAPAFGS